MIKITNHEIKEAGGLLPALSLKSAEYVATFLKGVKIKRPTGIKISRLKKTITHADPHLDEYFAILLFKACLPLNKRNIPIEEAIIHSCDNDIAAKSTWPEAAVFGIGNTVNGGAKPLLMYDEHIRHGQKQRFSSCSGLTVNELLGKAKLPMPLFKIFGEVDHIDANGGAHPKQLNNLVKWLHGIDFIFKIGKSSLDTSRARLGQEWKQAIVEATLVAALYNNEKPTNKDRNYWHAAAKDSLNHFEQHTLLRNQRLFKPSMDRLRNNVLNFKGAPLRRKLSDGSFENVLNSYKKSVFQQMILPYLIVACRQCWGPILGQIILSHYFESRIRQQVVFKKISETLDAAISKSSKKINMPSPVGKIEFQILSSITLEINIYDRKTRKTHKKKMSPWIIQLSPNPDVDSAKPALTNFLNINNDACGITSLKNPDGSLVLSRGHNVPYSVWEKLTDTLVKFEGDSNNPQNRGCWTVISNEKGVYESFLLNGNKAHQYVPRTSLDFNSLVDLVSKVWEVD